MVLRTIGGGGGTTDYQKGRIDVSLTEQAHWLMCISTERCITLLSSDPVDSFPSSGERALCFLTAVLETPERVKIVVENQHFVLVYFSNMLQGHCA